MKHATVWTQKRILYENKENTEELDDYIALEEKQQYQQIQLPSFQTSVSELFNLWYLHTNFYITPKVFSLIKNFSGVEAVLPISPYRMAVCFGYCFNCDLIRPKINDALMKLVGENDNEPNSE